MSVGFFPFSSSIIVVDIDAAITIVISQFQYHILVCPYFTLRIISNRKKMNNEILLRTKLEINVQMHHNGESVCVPRTSIK